MNAPATLPGIIGTATTPKSQMARERFSAAKPCAIAKLRRRAHLPFDPNDEQGCVDYCRGNARFYRHVVRAAKNPMLENIVRSALEMAQRPTYLRIGRQRDPTHPSAKHHRIADAIEQRAAANAQAFMYRHVWGSGNRILAALKAAGYP